MSEGAHPASSRTRPGGRAARVKHAVHQAVIDAVSEHGADQVSIPDVSRRAGVRDSSIYRRWGTRENLVLDALLASSARELPIPDTGSLHTDLTAFGIALGQYLHTPLGRGLVRALSAVSDSEELAAARETFWEQRYQATMPMITRAITRDELPADVDARQVMELLISPIHFRSALTRQPIDDTFVAELADRVIRAVQSR
ncbi:TetR/AcrR family transcriptional regulator [Mycobacterium paragordonae]|jgi:AcrR family transcriptional regulator|uniref:TetR/AcrR family transcriptional regulator n=1 Tax=Mycobacterium paragordonae TaxID=1389713 RepID=UPI0022AF4586|nr:TetR/AcrR family transcriptional regulator [Mycobacterium paragordonae]